jgi:hypothetical protein
MVDNRFNIIDILKQERKLKKVLVYPAHSIITDPTEKTKEDTYLNPIPINAYIRQVTPESVKWQYFGKIPVDSLMIMCEVRWYDTLKSAKKIIIDDLEYQTLWDDQKGFNIQKRESYLICVLVRKNV